MARVDADKCLFCGQCIEACPTGTLREARCGYRVVVGGKLGHHPRLATSLEGIHEREQDLDCLDHCEAFVERQKKNRKKSAFLT